MKFEAISKRFVRLVAPYFIGLFSLLSVSANNFTASNIIHSITNDPVIVLNGDNPQYIDVGETYEELNATADDVEDGDLTSQISIGGVSGINTNVTGEYIVKYSVTDTDGNRTTVDRRVIVRDRQSPVVELTGSSPISIEVGSTYYELGATATDNYDPSFLVTNSIVQTGTVTEEVVGSYTITYSATDNSENVGTTQRIVNVVDTTSPTIDITGDNPVTITLGTTYNDEGATANDNYDGDLTSEIVQTGSVNNSVVGENFIYYNVSDDAENTAIQKFRTVNVVDNTDPIITLIGSSEITHEVGTAYDDPGATATDNYDGDLSLQISTDINVNPNLLGTTYTVEYTVEDSSGNTAQEQRTVRVVDTVDPVISLIGNTEVTIEYQSIYTDAGATATDNYDGIISSSLTSTSTVNTDELGTYAFTYTVSDSFSNSAQVSRTVNVVDTTPPVITLNGSDEVNLQLDENYFDAGATAFDAHDLDVTSDISTVSSVNTSEVGVYYVTYTVSDKEGNSTQATRTVVVGSPPIITLQGTTPTLVEVGSSYIELGATAFDDPDGDLSENIVTSGSVSDTSTPGGQFFIQYSVSDNDGNSTVVYRTVNVVDTTAPEITLTGDATMNLEVGSTYTELGATATDNSNTNLTVVIGGETVDTSIVGKYTVTYNVSDAVGNPAAEKERTVNVVDTTAPEISINGDASITIEVGSTYTEAGATVTDNYDSELTVIIGGDTVNTSIIDKYLVVYNVSDLGGNSANQVIRTVNVVDTVDPIISLIGNTQVTIEYQSIYTDAGATATDNYDGIISSSLTSSSTVDTDELGEYEFTYTVSDSTGNTAQLTRIVYVVDTISPEITIIGDNPLYINLDETFTDPGYSANDNYDGNITSAVTKSGPNVDTSTEGEYFLLYNVTDSSSNAASQQTRKVVVGSPPVITLNGNNPMQLEYQEAYVEPNATATDSGVDLSSSISINGSVIENILGEYFINYSVTDSDGNSVTETRTVIVDDTTKPVITLNGDATQTIEFGNTYNDEGATALDNYDGDISSLILVTGNVDDSVLGQYQLAYNVIDENDNTAITVYRDVNIVDSQPPSLSLLGNNNIVLEVGSSYTDSGASAIDNYDGNITSSITSNSDLDTSKIDDYFITYDVSDSSENNAIQITRFIEVKDSVKPVITLSGSSSVNIEAGVVYTDDGATVTDNYDSDLGYNVDLSIIDTSILNEYTLTYTATDSSGNQAEPVFRTVEVSDTTSPVISLIGSSNIVIEASQSPFEDPGFTASDSYQGDITPFVETTGVVDMLTLGTYTLRYNVSDNSENPAIEKTRLVTVVDNTPPIITLQGEETINVELNSPFNDPGVTAFDNLDGDLTSLIVKEGNVDTFTAGVYNLTYKLVDSEGNVAQQVTRIVIVGSPPVITLDGDEQMTLEVGTPYVEPGATAFDVDEGDLTNQIQISGAVDETQLGESTILYTVEDSNGNITSKTRKVNVVDTTPPILVLADTSIITIEVFSPEYVDQTIFSYSDNHDETLSDSDVVVSDDINEDEVGLYTISFDLSDASGNAAITQIRKVKVVDTQSPTITLIGDSNVSIEKGSSYIDEGATAQDEYDGNITSSIVVTSNVNESVIGDYSVSYEVSDSSNNPATPVSRSVVVGPDVDAGGPYSVACIGETINIGSASNDLNYDYQWTSQPQPGATGGPVFGDPNSPQTAVTVYTTTLFTLKAYDNNGVEVGSDQEEVDVSGLPEAIVTNPQTICQGESIDLGDSPVSGNSYFWTADSSGWTSPLANPSHSPQSTTTYTLTITNIATGCQDTDQVTITVEEPTVVSLGPDNDTICASEAAIGYTFSAATSTSNDVTHQWSVISGNGSFDNQNELNATYFPGSNDLQTGSASLRLTTTSQGVCTDPVISNFDLNITKEPSIEAGVSAVELCENKSYELNASGTNFDPSSIVWTSSTGDNSTITGGNTLTPTYTPSAGDVASGGPITLTISVTGLDPCDDNGAITDSVTIDLIELPDVSVGTSNASICEDEPYQIVGASADNVSSFNWTTSGNGSFDNSTSIDPTYTPSDDDIDAGTVTLSLNYVPVSPCALPNDFTPPSMTLTISKNPIVDAGAENQVLCEGSNQIQGATAENYSSLLWTTSGDGQFTSDNTLSPFYSPGVGDLSNGVVTLKLTANADGACSTNEQSSLNFIVNKLPIISAGADDEVCSLDNYEISDASIIDSDGNNLTPTSILWSSSGSGTFNNPAILNPIYIPSDGDIANNEVVLTMEVTQDGCQLNPDSKILSFVSTAIANAGPDLTDVCEGDDGILTDAIVPDGHSFSWQVIQGSGTLQNETDINPVFKPTDGFFGEAILRLTVNPIQVNGDDCGLPDTDEVSIFIEPSPDVDLGTGDSICQPQDPSTTLQYQVYDNVTASHYNSLQWTAPIGSGSFDNPNILKPIFFPSAFDIANGGVILTLTALPNSPCDEPLSRSMFLEITQKPVINAPSRIDQCVSPNVSALTIELNQITYQFYDRVLWESSSNGSFNNTEVENPTYTPTAFDIESGSVTLTVHAYKDACTLETSEDIIIVFEDVPRVNAGGPDGTYLTAGSPPPPPSPEEVEVCAGADYPLDEADAPGAENYTWKTSGTGTFSNENILNPTYSPSASDINNGEVTLTLIASSTSACSYEIQDKLTLKFLDQPSIEVGTDRSICEGENLDIDIVSGNVVNIDPTSLEWVTDGSGIFNNENSLTTTYIPSDDDLDATDGVKITLRGTSNDSCDTDVEDSFTLTFSKKPTANAGEDLDICETGVIININDNDVTNYERFYWEPINGGEIINPNSLTPEFKPSALQISNGEAMVRLTAVANSPCTEDAKDSITLRITKTPKITLPELKTICADNNLSFTPGDVSIEDENEFNDILWTSSGGGSFTLSSSNPLYPTFTPTADEIADGETKIFLTVQNNAPCDGEVTKEMTLKIDPLPTAEAGNNINFCPGDPPISLSTAFATNESRVQWTGGTASAFSDSEAEQPIYTPSEEDIELGQITLTLTVYGGGECGESVTATDNVLINFSKTPNVRIERGDFDNDGTIEYPTEFCGSTFYTIPESQVFFENVHEFQWETSGNGIFSNENSLDTPETTYTPGSVDKDINSVTLTLYGTDINGCKTVSNSIVLDVLDGPSLDLSTSATKACYGTDLSLTAIAENYQSISWVKVSGSGQIISGGNSKTPIYRPANDSDIVIFNVTVVGEEPCTDSITDTLEINVAKPLEVTSFPIDTEVCFDENGIDISGLETSAPDVKGVETSGTGGYLKWSTTVGTGSFSNISIKNPTYFPSQKDIDDGFVTLELNTYPDESCWSNDADGNPIVDANGDPDPSDTESFVVTLIPAPVATMSQTGEVCADSFYQVLDATVNFDTASDYEWEIQGDGTLTGVDTLSPTYDPGSVDLINGEFTLILTVSGLKKNDGTPYCNDTVLRKTVTIVQKPVVELSLDTADYCTSDNPDVDDTDNHDNPILVQVQNLENIETFNWSTNSIGGGKIKLTSDGSAIFYPSQDDYNKGQVTVTLTGNPLAPCVDSVEDKLIITFKQAPFVDADITSEENILSPVCEDDPVASTQLNALALDYQSIQWTSSGTGSFDFDNILNPVYEFSAQDFDNGSVTLTITVEGDVNCSPKSDTVQIDLVKKPTVDLGNALIFCGEDLDEISISDVVISGDYQSLSWYTSGPGNLADETTLNPKYLPNPGEHGEVNLYLTVYPKAPCSEPISIPNPKTIIISEPPSVDIGLDTIELCEEDEEITLPDSSLGGAFAENYSKLLWTATGGSGLLTNEDTLTPTYKPSISDWNSHNDVILKLTVTGRDGCDSNDDEETITLKLIPKPVANAGPDVVICATDTNTSLPNQITTEFATLDSSESFYWSVSSNATGVLVQDATDPAAATYTVGEGETGIITLTLTAVYEDDSNIPGGCVLTDEDTMNITINPAPIADIGLAELVCDDQSIELQGSALHYSSVEWNAYVNNGGSKSPATGSFVSKNDLTTTFIPALLDFNYESIIIELTAFGLDGCLDHTVEEEITIPYVNAGDDDQICGLEPYTLLNAETNGTNYRWQIIDGNGTFSGQQTSTLLNPVYTPSQLDLDRGSVTLQLTVDPSGDCAGSDPISDEIEILITTPPSISVIDHSICQGIEIQNADGSFEIDPTEFAVTGAIPLNYDTILWEIYSGSGSIAEGTENNVVPTFIPEKTQSEDDTTVLKVTVTGSNACGDQSPVIEYVNLFVKPAAELFAGENDSVCENQSEYTLSGATSDNAQNFYWTENGTGEIISGQNTLTPTYEFGTGEVGTVIFTLTADGTGACDNTLTRTFELTIIEQPTATIDPIPVVCSDQVVSLSSTALNYKSIEEDIGTGEPGYEGLFWTSSGSGTFSDSNILNPTYNPSENDILNGVTLYLRAEAIAPCGNDFTTSVDVTFSDAVVVKVMSGDPTPDGHYIDSMCGTDEGFYSLDEAYTENADTWSWSTTNGTGSFSNAEIQNPIYTPSDQDRNNPDPIELVLTAEGGENCLPKTSTLKLTIDKLPEIINPVPSIYHCLNDEKPSNISVEGSFNISKYGIITTNSVKLDTVEWITDGDGSFVIGSDVLDPVYQPSPTDIQNGVTLKIRGYGENSCGSEYSEKEIEVTFSPKPEIKYIIDGQDVSEIEVCESSTASVYLDGTVLIDLDNIVWSTTNGTGTFNSKTATKPIYTPSEDDFDLPDGVVLKANATESNYPGSCAVEELEIVLNLVKKPIINANKTVFEFCKDDDEVTLTGITLPNVPEVGGEGFYDIKWVVSPGAMGYLTSDINKRDATYKPVGSDFDNGVTLTLIAYGKGNCGFEEEETFQINFTPVLDIDPGISGSICEGEDFPIEGASISGIGESGTFVWEANYSSDINNPNMDDLPNGTFINQGSLTEVIYRPGTNDLGRTVYIFLKPINLDNSICYDQDLHNTKFVSIDIAKDVSVYAGPDLTVCGDYGDPVQIFAASNIGNDPGEDEPLVTWTVFSINGNIVDNQLGISDTRSLQTTYRPISIDYVNGISTVTLKVKAAGNICSGDSSSDTMTITYYEPIDATAGDPISVCGTDNPIKIEDAEIISGENSYESIEWDITPGFGQGDILNKNSIEPTYVFSPNDSGEIRLELRISTKKFDAVEQPRGDGTILEANYNCVDPPVYFKTIFISSDITGTGSIEGKSVVCADDNNVITYSIGGDLDGVDQYQWQIPEGATYVNGTNENSAIINLLFDSFTENSTKTISVIASNGCGETRDLSKSINIKAQTQLTLDSGQDSDEQELCFGDSLDPIIYQIEGGAKNLQSELEIIFFDGTNEILASELLSNFSFLQLFNDVTISGQYTDATKAGTYSYQIKYADTESCFTEILALGSLTLRAPPVITLDSDPSSDNQGPICSGDEIDNIEYNNTGASVMISWSTGAKPIGIEYDINDKPFIINGFPEVQPGEASSTFTYTIIPIDSSGCEGLPQSGSIIVDAASPVEPSNLNLNNEIYCEGENVSFTFFLSDNLTAPLPITYTTQDYDISGNLVGTPNSSLINPPGFVPYWDFDQSKLIISGVPSSGPEVRRRYSFEINISSQANACTTASTTNPSGTFFISQSPTLSLYGNQLDINGSQVYTGNKNQELCESVALKPIFIKVDGTNNAPVATGLPIGISQPSPHPDDPTVYVLEGTPSSSNNDNEYNYEIVLESEYGCTETFSGTIYLDKNYQIVLQSTPSTENQEICGNSSLQPISYSYTPGIANYKVNWSVYEIGNNTDTYNQKPSGISVSDSGSVITIEGSPTAIDVNADGTINQNIVSYTIVTTTPNGCTDSGGVDLVQETRDGEFKVTSLPTLERTSQFATTSECEDEDIEIEFEASSNVQPILTWSQNLVGNNLRVVPDINNIWKIKGTVEGITENLSLDYTLIMRDITSLCESVPVLGTVFVENKHELKLISGLKQQDVCEGSDINPIVYEFAGGATSVTTSTLPPGLTPEVNPENNTITISGTPTSPISIDTPKIFTIETLGSGGLCTKITDTLKINLTPQPRFANVPQNYTLCEGDSVDFIELGLLDGADDVIVSWENNIEPPGTINHEIDDNTSPPTFRFTGELSGVSEEKTYGFTLIAFNSLTGCESTPRQGEITLQNGHELSLELGSKNQEICEGDPIEPIVYKWGGGATSANVIGLPTGLTRIPDNENKRITISGTPTVLISQDEELKFTIKTANSSDSCTEIVDTLTIGLIKQPSIRVLTGSQFQTRICEGVEIDSVVFELFNGATKPFINWEDNIKPPGTINLYDNNDGTHTLKGEITGFDQDKIYNYSITAVNLTKGCESTGLEGSLGVQKGHELRRLSSYSSTQQKICERQPMASNIIYEFGGGASSAEVIGLPPGLDWDIDDTLNRLTISGTPIVDVSEVTEYDYKVISLGNDCESIELDGKLTLEPDAEISLESPIATANQFICEGFPIEDITYTFGGGAIDVIYNGLPAGLTPEITYDPVVPNKVSKLTISGTPNVNVTEDTPFEYSIKALNNNGCVQPELKGTITIKANAELTLLSSSLSKDQIVCIGTDIIPVNIGYVNSEIPSVSGMPDGLYTTTDAANGILTIQGSVTELQLGNPNRKLTIIGTNTNGCRSQEIEIDIEVQPSYSIKPTLIVDDPKDTNNPSGASYVKNITCYDNNDGEIMVNLEVGGSSTNYIYSWTGPNNYVNTTQNNHIINLSAGIYVVQVEAQGARDCSISQTYTITEPDPVNIITNEIRPVSCTGSEDGLISVTINGGNENFYRNFIWEVLQEDVSCTTYTVRLRDNDNDGIFDIIDADIDNDGSIDPGKTDVNDDGMIDEANNPNYSFGTVSYQSCDGVFIQNNILRGEFSANGIYQVCAIPNTITADAKLDHDLDPNTDNIASVTISGGSASCSAGTWTKIDRLKGSSLASNLIEGIYRLTVIEGPDLNDIESNDLESLRNDPDICVFEEIYELPKDQILYGSVRVDETYCSLSGGYIDIDVNQSAGEVYFYYDGVRVPNTDVEVIAAEFGINTYRVLIQNPNSNGSFEIRNATGCGVVVAQDLLDTNVLTPIISYTSPELEKYGTISERSNILFTLAGNTSYYRVEWDFGDASPIAAGERVSHQYFADGTYTVTVFVYNASGCFTMTTEEIVVGKGYTILIPNAFSPNGDNINEIIRPVFTGLKAVEYHIYNSQGILVYQEFVSEDNLSTNGTIEIMGWDGENSDPSSNFYVYKIIGTRINEELVTKTGTIFLIE